MWDDGKVLSGEMCRGLVSFSLSHKPGETQRPVEPQQARDRNTMLLRQNAEPQDGEAAGSPRGKVTENLEQRLRNVVWRSEQVRNIQVFMPLSMEIESLN